MSQIYEKMLINWKCKVKIVEAYQREKGKSTYSQLNCYIYRVINWVLSVAISSSSIK